MGHTINLTCESSFSSAQKFGIERGKERISSTSPMSEHVEEDCKKTWWTKWQVRVRIPPSLPPPLHQIKNTRCSLHKDNDGPLLSSF